MKLRPQLATIVREMSVETDLPVDMLLEAAVLQWIEHRAPQRVGTLATDRLVQHHALLSLTRHDGVEN